MLFRNQRRAYDSKNQFFEIELNATCFSSFTGSPLRMPSLKDEMKEFSAEWGTVRDGFLVTFHFSSVFTNPIPFILIVSFVFEYRYPNVPLSHFSLLFLSLPLFKLWRLNSQCFCFKWNRFLENYFSYSFPLRNSMTNQHCSWFSLSSCEKYFLSPILNSVLNCVRIIMLLPSPLVLHYFLVYQQCMTTSTEFIAHNFDEDCKFPRSYVFL